MRRALGILVVMLAATGVAFAVFPFERPAPRGTFTYSDDSPSSRCASPIVSAFRHDTGRGGWFGYAPLTSTPDSLTSVFPSCQDKAQRRLAIAALFEVGALLVWVLPRRRFRGQANPQPNLAA